MEDIIQIVKNEDEELPIPTAWRATFSSIVESFKNNDFRLNNKIEDVHTVSETEAERIAGNIGDYGDQLVSLPDEAWDTSIYRWMRGYWDVLVDLHTVDEGASDLVLFVKVRENESSYCFTVESVHVP